MLFINSQNHKKNTGDLLSGLPHCRQILYPLAAAEARAPGARRPAPFEGHRATQVLCLRAGPGRAGPGGQGKKVAST